MLDFFTTHSIICVVEVIGITSFSSREIIRRLKDDGWVLKNVEGDHYQFVHPTKPGKVTVTHPVKDVPKKTYHTILKQAGLK